MVDDRSHYYYVENSTDHPARGVAAKRHACSKFPIELVYDRHPTHLHK